MSSNMYVFPGYPPGSYDFGTVAVSSTSTVTMIPAARPGVAGTGPITVASVTITGDIEFSITSALSPNPIIPPGTPPPPFDDSTLGITFAPTGVGLKTATLTIVSDSADSPVVITLTGTGGNTGFLTLVPQTVNDFGPVLDGTISPVLNVLAENNSGADVTVTAIDFSATTGPIIAASVNAGGSGYVNGDTGTIDGDSGDAQYVVTGVDGSGGVLSFDILNPGTNYNATTGFTTTPITGIGTGFVIDISSVRTGEFAAGPGQPTLPFTLLANGASPPVAIPVVFEPTVTGYVLDPNAVVVTSTATNTPAAQPMAGTGVLFFPAYIMPAVPLRVLFAFVLMGAVVILEADPDDLDCEESASFTRIYDWGAPLMEKYFGRAIIRYEDESTVPFDLTATCIAPRLPSPVVTSIINEGGNNDDLIRNLFFDFEISDDLVQVTFSRAADDGPVQITEMFHEVDVRGEVIENA